MNKYKLVFFVILFTFSYSACSANIDSYKKDAAALCEVYNPKNWQDYVKSHGANDIYQELGVRTREAIKTDEFREIFKKFVDERQPDFHGYLHKQVSQLIGEAWQCGYFDEFDKPAKRKEIQLTVKGVKEVVPAGDGGEIIITIDAAGKYYVNELPLINNEEGTLNQAIKLTAKNTKPKIVIRADAKAPSSMFASIIYVANSLGLKSVSIEMQ